jgi:hypothetical protein
MAADAGWWCPADSGKGPRWGGGGMVRGGSRRGGEAISGWRGGREALREIGPCRCILVEELWWWEAGLVVTGNGRQVREARGTYLELREVASGPDSGPRHGSMVAPSRLGHMEPAQKLPQCAAWAGAWGQGVPGPAPPTRGVAACQRQWHSDEPRSQVGAAVPCEEWRAKGVLPSRWSL